MVGCTGASSRHVGSFRKLRAHIIKCNHDLEIANIKWCETINPQSSLSVKCSSKNLPSKDSLTSSKSATNWKASVWISEPVGHNSNNPSQISRALNWSHLFSPPLLSPDFPSPTLPCPTPLPASIPLLHPIPSPSFSFLYLSSCPSAPLLSPFSKKTTVLKKERQPLPGTEFNRT